MSQKTLLILACSNRKSEVDSLLPAIERYDGGSYRVIKKLQREAALSQNLDTKIISAKYGLIDSQILIPNYEQRMSKIRMLELKDQIQTDIKQILAKNYSEIYIDLGQDYLPCLEDIKFSENTTIAKGRIGERLSSLKKWLLGLK